MTTTLEVPIASDYSAIKARQKATWESGDFGKVAQFNEPGAAEFMAGLPVRPGLRVLDIACGTGNLAVLAAQRGACVSGVDLATNLVVKARMRARRLGLKIDYLEGDAEALPYPDASFDLVVSMYGVMFVSRPLLAAGELLRVTKAGGLIALANWTPEGFIGKMFDVFERHLPSQSGLPSPLQWGVEEAVRTHLSHGVTEMQFTRRMARLDYPLPVAGTVEFFRRYYGPTNQAFASLEPAKQAALRRDLEQVQGEFNISEDPGRTAVEAEYLEIKAVRNAM